jgi:hypothetical protein
MPGENLLLKNKFVEMKIHVTEKFWYNERVQSYCFNDQLEIICF